MKRDLLTVVFALAGVYIGMFTIAATGPSLFPVLGIAFGSIAVAIAGFSAWSRSSGGSR